MVRRKWKWTKRYVFRGQWMTRKQIAAALGLSELAVRDRTQGDTVLDVPRKKGGRKAGLYLFRGERLTVAEIAKITGKSTATITRRKSGDAVLEPRNPPRTYTFRGKTLTLSRWAKERGLKQGTIQDRINTLHWPVDAALTHAAMNNTERKRVRDRTAYMLALYQETKAHAHANTYPGGGSQLQPLSQGPAGGASCEMDKN